MILLIIYVHSVLLISKDTLIISHLGAEAVSAIKVWAVLPISLVWMFVYIKLSDRFTGSQLFHMLNWFFIAYFVFFASVCYPYREALSIHINDALILRLPVLRYLFKVISSWHYCLFYVFSEMWIVMMLSIGFWQLVNHITSVEESKRLYPLLGLVSQFGLMLAGFLSKFSVVDGTNWQPTLNNVTISIAVAGGMLSLCLVVLRKVIGFDRLDIKKGQKKTVNTIGLGQSLKYIASSKPILLIMSLLLCYNISTNLIEGVWQKSIEILFVGSANQIHYFMSNVNLYISVLSVVGSLVGGYVLRTCKWRTSALVTPITCIVIGGVFFLSTFLKDGIGIFSIKISVLTIAAHCGALYNIFSRSTKHTLFDYSKEMLYIPMDNELKTKGKAAAETIGMKFGKGGGAFIQQSLLMLFPTLTLLDLSPIIFMIFSAVLCWWLIAVFSLNRVCGFEK